MKIEKWILAEMLARLLQLRDRGVVDAVEGEHKYPIKKTSRYEHCDLWWRQNRREHWLEVKTVSRHQKTTLDSIREDLTKRKRLRRADVFHHLALVFPVAPVQKNHWRTRLCGVYRESGFALRGEWDHKTWPRHVLYALLFR